MKSILQATLVAAALAASFASNAAVMFNDAGGKVEITLTSDVTFVATGTADSYTRFVFEDAYSGVPGVGSGGVVSNTIGLADNGVTIGGLSASSLWGPLSFTLGEIDGNDFTISFVGSTGIHAGDVVTLKAGSAVTNLSSTWLPDLSPTEVTMVANSGNALSTPVALTSAVPEPSSLALMGLGLAAFAASRRRRA